MKHLIYLLLAFFSLSMSTFAQNGKVVLCEDYNKTTGIPTGINKNWDVEKEKGSYVYIIYSQDNIIKEKLSLYVDKKNEKGSYIAFDTQDFDYNPTTDKKKWAMYDYKFTESGDYRISVMGKADDALAIVYTNIGYMKDSGNDKDNSSDDDASDTYYYEDSKVTFGESAENGELKGEATEFRLINGKRDFVCMISQDKALKVKEIKVSIYSGDSYKDLVSEETYTVGGLDWDWIKVPISVTKPGKYVVDVYNEKDTFINSGYFEIKR
ncbi:MAG: hypothetical protein U0T69_06490 [Chitinophagales bacterium]